RERAGHANLDPNPRARKIAREAARHGHDVRAPAGAPVRALDAGKKRDFDDAAPRRVAHPNQRRVERTRVGGDGAIDGTGEGAAARVIHVLAHQLDAPRHDVAARRRPGHGRGSIASICEATNAMSARLERSSTPARMRTTRNGSPRSRMAIVTASWISSSPRVDGRTRAHASKITGENDHRFIDTQRSDRKSTRLNSSH